MELLLLAGATDTHSLPCGKAFLRLNGVTPFLLRLRVVHLLRLTVPDLAVLTPRAIRICELLRAQAGHGRHAHLIA